VALIGRVITVGNISCIVYVIVMVSVIVVSAL